MATYRSFNELNNKTLRECDSVYINSTKFMVNSRFLAGGESNDVAFLELGISDKMKMKLAEDVYGYSPSSGYWPESKSVDYEALTRLTLVLLAFFEGSDEVFVEMPDKKWKTVVKSEYIDPSFKVVQELFPIRVGDYNARYQEGALVVGCQQIPFNVVEKVYKSMKKVMGK